MATRESGPNVKGNKMGKSKRELKLEKEEEELNNLIQAELAGNSDEAVEESEENLKEEEVSTKSEEVKVESVEEGGQETAETPDNTDWKKRFGDLRRHSQAEKDKFEKTIEELNGRIDTLKAESKVELLPPASNETIEEWKGKYPEVASIVETIADQIATDKFNDAKLSLKEVREEQFENRKQKALSQIKAKHSDFDTLKESDDFHNWIEEQPKWAQDSVFENSEDSQSVIRVLDLYKADKGLGAYDTKKVAKEAAAAVTVKSKAKPAEEADTPKFSESQVHKMSAEEFEANEAKILESQRKGTFLYDLTGGMR